MTKNLPSLLAALAWMALSGAILPAATADAETIDQTQIETLMKSTWGTPEKPIRIEPIVVSGDYAIASWAQNQRGGRALLHRIDHKWTVVLCSGDALKRQENLMTAGIPANAAAKLAQDLDAAENSLEPQHRALFSLFEGTVEMTK